MNYRETVEYILSIPLFAQKIGTENLASLLERLGNPQDKSRVIHIAGTNGKGSTAKALATILMHAGFHVGLFTSPHLVSINERIRYDDEMISDEDFTWAFEQVRKKFIVHPSFFEVMFAMAAVYYEKKQPDYVIYETGMGGRLDATNVVRPELCIITSVGLDHMEYLGDTIAKIAGEKAGIIKPSVPVVYFKRDAVSSGIIETRAKELDSAVTAVEKSNYIINEIDDKTIDFSFHNRYYNYDHLRIPKTSLYQVENTCLAVASFDILMQIRDMEYEKNAGADVRIEQAIRSGLLDFSWEGRMEEIAPDLFVDGAHNPEAVECYCRTLRTLYTKKKKILVFAAVKDKDYDTMIRDLTEELSFEKIIVTSVDNKRKAPVALIADRFRKYTGHAVEAYEDIAEAMNAAIRYKEQITDSAVYCVGSLYLVGEVKRWLSGIKEQSANMEEYHDKL